MADRPVITLTTDFGEGSRYVAEMKGVILSINPAATIVDITHAIQPQDIEAGSRTINDVTLWFPQGSIHVVVVDPGVGSDREILAVDFDGLRLVCPDNGLLTNLAERRKPNTIVAIENSAYRMPRVAPTFHGRDIMAPAAAHLSLGLPLDRLGPPRRGLVRIATREAIVKEQGVGQRIEGEVIEVDSFGNLITNITDEMLAGCPKDSSVTIRCDEHETIGVYETYADQPPMTLVALVGSTGRLELAIVDDSAKIMLGVGAGAPVSVEW